MKKFVLLALAVAVLALASPAHAQDAGLRLGMSRDLGYAGFSNDIEGLFSLRAEGPANLQRVEFYIDSTLIGTVTESPFRIQFTTKDHTPGERTMYAIGYTADGQELRSNEITRVFLSPEETRGKVVELVVPILGIVVLLMLLTTVLPALLTRKKPQRGTYGLSGGGVCPNCALPFPLRFFSFSMGARRFDRCPHCGKWVMVRRAKKDELAEAEARWAAQDEPTGAPLRTSREDEQIDSSRYEN
ncbi:MAG: hypothetical protein KIS88_09070 [Anaerolineales bacterium]|nr:hypothetical protein [Anaerolineales bacterium]